MKIKQIKNLINVCVKDVFSEAKSEPGSPNVFWLVTSVGPNVPKIMENLAKGVLEGVAGISDNKKIVMHWLGIGRDAVLIMSAKKLLELNKGLYKIQYNNADELLFNDMKLLARIWNKEHGPKGRRGILNNISDQLTKNLRTSPDKVISGIGYGIYGGHYNIANKVPLINSVDDLSIFIRNRVINSANEYKKKDIEKLPLEWWKKTIKNTVEQAVNTYKSEGEWVVSENSLKVPRNSRLLVAVHNLPKEFPEVARVKLQNGEMPKLGVDIPTEIWTLHMRSSLKTIKSVYEYGLDKRYDVRFIDLDKFKKIQIQMQMRHSYK